VVNTGRPETHRTDSCLASLRRPALIRAGAGRAPLSSVTAFVFVGMRGNVLCIGLSGACARIAVALPRRGALTLFLLSSGWHLISNLSPSIKQRTCRLLRH
jgi:hypothetical protein